MTAVFTDDAARTWFNANMTESNRRKKKTDFFIFIDELLQIEP
jgi:hypothetical protein